MSSAAVSAYSARSRASDRTGRIRDNMNRSSAYILGTSTDYTGVAGRRPRDSSIGTMGRPTSALSSHHHIRDSSLTRGGRGRDSSLPRFKEGHVSLAKVPSDLVTSLIAVRHNLAMPELGAETMKYNRQNAVKDIHTNFMRGLKDTNNKISSDAATTEEIEKRTKSYQKIISDAPSAYYNLTEEQSKKHCMSEMFIETGRFSTRTVAAINNLEGAEMRHKKEGDYQWRKEMEEYEKSAEFAKEKRMRSIKNNHNRRMDKENEFVPISTPPVRKSRKVEEASTDDDHWATAAIRKKQPPPTQPSAPLPEKPKYVKPSQRQDTENKEEETTPRKSWRERMAERQKKEAAEATEAAAAAKTKEQTVVEVAKTVPADENKPVIEAVEADAPPAAKPAEEPKEGEDEDGTKKLKFDFDNKMAGLEAEMAAGRSKLAKLRERIRKAKGAIKDADKALEEDDKKAAELQRKKDMRAVNES